MDISLDTFRDIPDKMLWKGAALHQIDEFVKLAKSLGLRWTTVGSHTSKSIQLPVGCFSVGGVQVYIRNNFHDINVCVVSETPLTTPLSALFDGIITPRDWGWYLSEVNRCRNYSWRYWTDEQMDDPNLLMLTPDAPYHAIKRPSVKANWIKRLTDPDWYRQDWSSQAITWEGDFGPDAKLYVQGHAFLEGISGLVPKTAVGPYAPGCRGFAIALSDLTLAEAIIRRLNSDASRVACTEANAD